MKKPFWSIFPVVGFLMVLLIGCAPATTPALSSTNTPAPTSTPESTATTAPTSTPTSIPIPGVDEPIIVNEVSVRVLGIEWKDPVVVTGFSLEAGYKSLMIKIELRNEANDAADMLNKLSFRDIVVLDENDNESPIVFFNLPVSSLTGSDVTQLELFFAVLENATPSGIRFVDDQTIDLTLFQ